MRFSRFNQGFVRVAEDFKKLFDKLAGFGLVIPHQTNGVGQKIEFAVAQYFNVATAAIEIGAATDSE